MAARLFSGNISTTPLSLRFHPSYSLLVHSQVLSACCVHAQVLCSLQTPVYRDKLGSESLPREFAPVPGASSIIPSMELCDCDSKALSLHAIMSLSSPGAVRAWSCPRLELSAPGAVFLSTPLSRCLSAPGAVRLPFTAQPCQPDAADSPGRSATHLSHRCSRAVLNGRVADSVHTAGLYDCTAPPWSRRRRRHLQRAARRR